MKNQVGNLTQVTGIAAMFDTSDDAGPSRSASKPETMTVKQLEVAMLFLILVLFVLIVVLLASRSMLCRVCMTCSALIAACFMLCSKSRTKGASFLCLFMSSRTHKACPIDLNIIVQANDLSLAISERIMVAFVCVSCVPQRTTIQFQVRQYGFGSFTEVLLATRSVPVIATSRAVAGQKPDCGP